MDFLKYLGLIIAVWFFTTGSAPIQWAKSYLGIGEDDTPKNVWIRLIQKLLSCSLCFGFWVGLIYYQSIEFACLTSIGAELFTRLWNRILV